MKLLAILLCVFIGSHNLWVLCYRAVLAGTVYFYQVLIYNASGTNVKVSNLRVTHLSIRKTYVLA